MGVDAAIDLSTGQRRTVLELLDRHLPGTEAWVYRSRAKRTSRPQPDLDLVVFATPEQQRQVGDLRKAFEEVSSPFQVDLFVWDDVSKSFRKQIEAEHVVLAPKSAEQANVYWHDTFWGDIAALEYGRALRGYATARGSFRVFGTNGPIGWHDETLCEDSGVIVGRKGAYRGIHYSADPFFVIDTAFYLKPKVDMNVRWAYYALLTQDINGMDSGSAIPSTSREEFYGLPVSVPPLPEQRAIAHVLGTLDDKIELNRRMNATLEAMVRALFNSWFVDFDPVRAKIAGRDTGLPRHIADIFPDSIDEEGKPEGWRVGTLADVASCPRRVISPTDVADATPYIGLEHMPRRSISLIKWENASKVTSNKSAFKAGEFLFGKLRPYFHKVGLAPIDGICSTDIVVVVPRGSQWSVFTLACLCSDEFVRYTDQTSTGTKMPRTSWKTMQRYKIPVPPKVVARAFQSLAQPLIDRLTENVHESRNLSQARDVLLPKLVSGETRFRDPKWLMGEVA